MLERDYFFEFSGMPKSGKTTITDIMSHSLKREGYDIKDFHGGGRYAPIEKNSLAELNIFLLCQAVEFILVSAKREKVKNRIFLLDRGLFDRCVFTRTLLMMEKISGRDYDILTNFMTSPILVDKIDGVFLFTTTPELSLEREYKNKLLQEKGRVMNTNFLSILRDASYKEYDSQKGKFRRIELLDTQVMNGDVLETARFVLQQIKSIIEQQDNDR